MADFAGRSVDTLECWRNNTEDIDVYYLCCILLEAHYKASNFNFCGVRRDTIRMFEDCILASRDPCSLNGVDRTVLKESLNF